VSVEKVTDEKLIPEDQAKAREALEALREILAKDIQAHHVSIGMTTEECRLALGRPSEVNRSVTANHESLQWVYRRYSMGYDLGDRYLYFDDGVLTSVQD